MKYSSLLLIVLFAMLLSACSGGSNYYCPPTDDSQSHSTTPELQANAPQPPAASPPNAPYNLSATATSQNAVALQWTDNSGNENGFMIYRGNNLIATVGANVNSYQDIGLEAATTYQYLVEAYNEAGESGTISCTVRTLNPPITVWLDRIGVYDNREDWLRGEDGEIYVYVVVSDSENATEKLRFPQQQGQHYKLAKNETVDVGVIIFSTDEVGDYLSLTIVGYEDDGGGFEPLVYEALGIAIESQMPGGTGGLLEVFDFSLNDLVAQFFGAEDDWLGSYEQTWNYNNNWGIGQYTDIVCEDERGVLCLRLWFTIESQ